MSKTSYTTIKMTDLGYDMGNRYAALRFYLDRVEIELEGSFTVEEIRLLAGITKGTEDTRDIWNTTQVP